MKKILLILTLAITFSTNCYSQLNCVEPSYINNSINCGSISDTVCGCNGISYFNFCDAFYHNGITSWTSGSCANPPACHADFTYNSAGANYTFTNTSSAGTTNWYWDFGDTSGYSTSPTTSYTYNFSGTHIVCLTTIDASGCESTTCKVVEVVAPNLNCSALFGYSDSCGTVHFIDFSSGTNLSYDWDFGDGTFGTGLNPYHSYASGNFYTVCMTITDTVTNCTSQFCQSCFIHVPTGVASFTYSNPIVFQIAFDASFTGTASSWNWDFGNGNSANIEDTTYTYTGCVYTACLQVADNYGCLVAPVCQTINACSANPCYVNFTHTDSCNVVEFTSQSLSGSNSVYSWDFGDGTFSSDINPVHNYVASGNYSVCLILNDTVLICADTVCHIVEVHVMSGSPVFSYTNISFGPNVVEFVSSFADTAIDWIWNFGDGQTFTDNDSSIQHTYTNCIYMACLQMYDQFGCYSPVVCDTVIACELSNSCNAVYIYNDSCGTVAFNNLSTSLDSLTYHWNFGDFNEDSVEYPVHTFPFSGGFEVCLTIADSANLCFKTYCDSVWVHVSQLACEFSYNQLSHNPNVVNFFDMTTIFPGSEIANWEWNFNDTTAVVTGIQNPTHTFNGCEYLVCLTVTDSSGCSSQFCDSVHLCDDNILEIINPEIINAFYDAATNSIVVSFSNGNNGVEEINLFDILGRKQFNKNDFENSAIQQTIRIPFGNKKSGLYFLAVRNKYGTKSIKIAVIK